MNIRMIGIDHSQAGLSEREQFSFTKAQAISALKAIGKSPAVSGCLLLSTCNRTELWVSQRAEEESLFALLNLAKEVDREAYTRFFLEREGEKAISHLLKMACGMESRIVGEDQILSQIRDALELSRKYQCGDTVIEKVFQSAISAAKEIKTNLKLTGINPSAAQGGISLLREKLGELSGLPCLVIGNGQIGKLAAEQLVSYGAEVSMTLRKKYHKKEEQDSIIPGGCRMVPYEDRLTGIEGYRVVVSATRSPHYTIKQPDILGRSFTGSIWIDLAVPRDIDPEIEGADGIKLYNMDDIGDGNQDLADRQEWGKAEAILQEHQEELVRWFEFRPNVDLVKDIAGLVAADTGMRLKKNLQGDEAAEDFLQRKIEAAADKSVRKLLFGLRENLPKEHWHSCLGALEISARRETIKTGTGKKRRGKR